MQNTFFATLCFATVVIGATQATLKWVCERAAIDDNKLRLDYEEDAAIVNISLLDRSKQYNSYKIHLFADWNHQFETEELTCQDAHLLPHTVYDISLENVYIIPTSNVCTSEITT